MEKVYTHCQSCGMPFKRDPRGSGTNADGSRSTVYCSYCYADGKYVDPDMTIDQMKARVREKIKEGGFPGFLAVLFTRKLPRLERWRT